MPELQSAWLTGYRTVAPALPGDEAMMPVFIMLRRLLLMAWIASHKETATAQTIGTAYTEGTLTLGERFLATCRRARSALPTAPKFLLCGSKSMVAVFTAASPLTESA